MSTAAAAVVSLPIVASAGDESPSRLPFLGDAARERGIDLPLPFGIAVTLTGLDNRGIEVTDARVGIEGNPAQSISEFVELGSTSNVFNANLKFDAWIFPFMNLYGIVGYIKNESQTRARVTLPGIGPLPPQEYTTDIDTDLTGMVGGIGMTLAGGYENFYMVADVNYSQSDLGFDNDFTAVIASVRAGYNGRLGDLPMQMWIGVGSWDTAATATGHGDLSNGMQLNFEADQRPETQWMYDIGANLEISKRFQLFMDLGADFEGGVLLVIGPTWRF